MTEKNKILNFYLQNKGGLVNLKGKSMYPSLQEGWKTKIAPVNAVEIHPCDIVVFGKDALTCHRVIGKVKFFGKYYFIQKGDNSYMGGMVKAEDLTGKVVEVFNEGGKRIDELIWRDKPRQKEVNILYYLYLFMYFIKRFIWRDNMNMFTRFVKRLCWKFIHSPAIETNGGLSIPPREPRA